jgi:cystathionine gamma-lyase
MRFETKVIHAGVNPDPTTGAIMTPIYQTSTYVQEAPGKYKGFEYGRTQNPTRSVLEANLAALEEGSFGICFASGLAAMDAVMKLLRSGDEIVSCNDLYGGSYRQMVQVFGKYQIKSHFTDLRELSNLESLISDRTRLIWVETPTNPLLQILDLRQICSLAKERNILTCVDNTFASPYLQQPLKLGADIVLHSATKYLAGHSDLILGGLICNDPDLAQKLYFLQNASGAVPGPMDCFLTLRGIKTLPVRMDRACANASAIADYLAQNRRVARVFYPGLKESVGHDIASRQMKHFGAMISFDLKDDRISAAKKVLEGTRIFSFAESLGGVESLIGHPATMTHASIPREERLQIGLSDSLIRLSIGIEHMDDLIEDLENAISK